MKRVFSQDEVKELLSYNPKSGEFTFKPRDAKWFKGGSEAAAIKWNARTAMKSAVRLDAGNKNNPVINLLNYKYAAGKLAFLYMLGFIPDTVGRVDKDLSNTKWSNLFKSTVQKDAKRHRVRKDNKTGVSGVFYYSKGKWIAGLGDKDKRISLGYFDSFFEAVCARKSAEINFGYINKLTTSNKTGE
tara:strand:+ start:108 stop:668 length:561 start_codon:yes stop_codon:yes gene_type:complete